MDDLSQQPTARSARIRTRTERGGWAFTVAMSWPAGVAYNVAPFERELADAFGGFNRVDGIGHWDGGHEHSVTWYFTAHDHDEATDTLDTLLERHGAALRNRWVHVDVRYVSLQHREVVPIGYDGHEGSQWPDVSVRQPEQRYYVDKALRHAECYGASGETIHKFAQGGVLYNEPRTDVVARDHGVQEPSWDVAINGGTTERVLSLLGALELIKDHARKHGNAHVYIGEAPDA